MISNFFDASRIFPGFNFEDYLPQKLQDRDLFAFDLFMGHMTWAAVEIIEERTGIAPRVFTVMRDPVARANSQIAFIDRLIEQGMTSSINLRGGSDALAELRTAVAADLAPEGTMLQCVLLLTGSWHNQSYAERLHAGMQKGFADPDAGMMAGAARQLDALIDERLTVGMFEHLRKTVDLLAATYTLPYCELTQERLNASGAIEGSAPTEAQRLLMARWHDLPNRLHRRAEAQFAASYARHFCGCGDLKTFLDERYRNAVFRRMPLCSGVDLRAEAPWPGTGWATREGNQHGQYWRRVGRSGAATIFARLSNNRAHIVSVRFHTLPSIGAIDDVKITANGTALTRGSMAFEGNTCVQHYLLARAGACKQGDEVTLAFEVPQVLAAKIAIAGLSITPIAP